MVVQNPHAFESIDARTVRAATECMATDAYAHGEGSGMFDVYSASDNIYTVSLRDPLGCTCPDFAQRGDQLGDSGCKHIRRIKMALGIDPIPEELEGEVDGTLITNGEKFTPDTEIKDVEPEPADTTGERAVQVATDGGRVFEPETQGSEAEDIDADLPEITEHVEPPEQGGARFIRCEGCGTEVIGTDERRLIHREDCPHAIGDDYILPAREGG
jgi:hypothetical protein